MLDGSMAHANSRLITNALTNVIISSQRQNPNTHPLLLTMAEALSSQHTTTFPDLLNQAMASVVISTYQAGKLILLRSTGNALNTHFVSLAKPMGVAYSKNRLSVGSGVQVVDYFNMPSVGPKVHPRGTHDSAFLPRRLHYTGDIDIHEMAFTSEQELWIVNTKMSCLGTIDIQHSFVPRWKPPFISGYDLTDRCHLNGLAMRDGKPRYVSSLGVSDRPAGWRVNKASGGMIMDIQSNEFVVKGLSMPHSPRWYRDQLWVLESGAGQLITVDIDSGEKRVVAELPGFCRGIDFIDRYALIGLSEVRETAVFAGLPLTEREQDRKCGVWVVDIESGQTMGYLVFSSGVQEIFSVQIVPGKYPALLDLNDPLLSSSYSLPDDAVNLFTPPDSDQLAFEKAVTLHQQKKLPEAISAYQQLLESSPDNVEVLYNLGVAQHDSGHIKDAISSLLNCIEHRPNHAAAQNSLGLSYLRQNNRLEALKHFDLAIDADRKYADAHVNRARVKMMSGELIEGLIDYEWRWQLPNNRPLNCQQPRWTGEDIRDKTLLIHTEQTLSDSVLFSRYLDAAKERCNRLVVVCPEPLRLLFKALPFVDEVRPIGALPAGLFDVYAPIVSLPLILDIKNAAIHDFKPTMPLAKGVIVPQLEPSSRFKIGISLDTQFDHLLGNPIDQENSSPSLFQAALMDSLSESAQQASMFSLQHNISRELAAFYENRGIVNLDQELISLSHIAALMSQMGLIITSNDAIANVSGSLGLPTIMLLPVNSGWQWGRHPVSTDWYPSISLVRLQDNESSEKFAERISSEAKRRLR